ncbi:hypothetical protein KUL42_15780 [Alteromonas sp. KUL42]|uniref:cell division protein ZipA n=1 Tax=Alteromonas sp. KUL42 TaxID=2480797 RepID=UPI001035CC5E|nr:cell division protein ZipA [Alteromonas sp. KUL42]TAP36610.1 cell division protein ZipA [Alteromonas sp. KUL42]GEA06817.1 hypothetical protein KUL42_15780 [Alteromonas sp. KUL42]
MEDELRLFLLLGGTVFIIAVLSHGIWKIRKNTKQDEKPRITPRQWSEDTLDDDALEEDLSKDSHGFDDLGIGAVRVVETADRENEQADESKPAGNYETAGNVEHTSTTGLQRDNQETSEDSLDNSNSGQSTITDKDDTEEGSKQKTSEPPPQPKPKLYGSVVSNPKPHMAGNVRGSFDSIGGATSSAQGNVAQFPEPPGFLLKEGASEQIESVKIDEGSGTKREPVFDETEDSSVKHDEKLAQEVSDFSLDAPKTPHELTGENQEQSDQNKRFSRHKRSRTPIRKREEPNFGDDQMRIDFDESHGAGNYTEEAFSANDDAQAETSSSSASSSSQKGSAEQEVLVLNVRAPADEPISGAALLPMLLTLGFKFGDQDIFHRHVNSNGKGPVLFSLANMFKPGVFDIDNLETFETQGVSLFMILPIEGDPHQVFNMMHNAARKIADEFGAQVLDGRRSVLTKQGLQQYVEKIREFERKRMIPRN